MTEKKGNLHGKILKGECEYVFFKEEELIALYKEKIDVKEWFKETYDRKKRKFTWQNSKRRM